MAITRKTTKLLKQALLASAALVAALSVTSPAFAQTTPGDTTAAVFDRGQNVSVLERGRPDFEATGFRLGAIEVRPSLTLGVESDDNIFYSDVGERDDFALRVNPEVEMRTTWSRNAARLVVGLNDRKYDKFASENRTDEYVVGEVRLDVIGDTSIAIGGSHYNLGQGRNAPETVGASAKLGDYDVTEGYVALTAVFARTRLSGRVYQRAFKFDPVPLIGGGFDNSPERDRKETGVSLRAEYAISPRTAVFGEVGFEDRDYKRKPPAAAFNRDNELRRVLVGVNFDLTSLARGELAIGQLDQSYDVAGLSGASGLAMTAQLEWFPQEITTVTFNASRRAEETNVGFSGSYTLTEAGVRVDHELLRNVIVSAQVSGGNRDFEGISREDDITNAGVGVRYLVNRSVEVGAGWGFERQESSGANRDNNYEGNRITLTVTLRR
jgi:hypothetical protein